jgi:hypothetical protein
MTGLKEDWRILGYDIRLGRHYHQERRRFWEFWNNVSAYSSVLAGSFAAAAVKYNQAEITIALALIVPVVQGAALVFGFTRKMALHSDLYRSFTDLENTWIKNDPEEDRIKEMKGAKNTVEKTEPSPMRILVVRCEKDICERYGYLAGEWIKPSSYPAERWKAFKWYQRRFAQYLPKLD